jgi:hypothetical protein
MPTSPNARSLGDTGSATIVRAVTPSDSVDLPLGACRGFHVNVSGAVRFLDMDGNDVTLTVVAGMPLAYTAKRIFATNTTATGIFALY